MIPTRTENPNGLYQRYAIRKANGEECDPRAIYFVLRLDSNGDDPGHIAACRAAARTYVANAPSHLRQVAEDLSRLLDHLDSEPSVLVPEGDP